METTSCITTFEFTPTVPRLLIDALDAALAGTSKRKLAAAGPAIGRSVARSIRLTLRGRMVASQTLVWSLADRHKVVAAIRRRGSGLFPEIPDALARLLSDAACRVRIADLAEPVLGLTASQKARQTRSTSALAATIRARMRTTRRDRQMASLLVHSGNAITARLEINLRAVLPRDCAALLANPDDLATFVRLVRADLPPLRVITAAPLTVFAREPPFFLWHRPRFMVGYDRAQLAAVRVRMIQNHSPGRHYLLPERNPWLPVRCIVQINAPVII